MILSPNKLNKAQKEYDDAFSTLVKSKDNWTCQICGVSSHVHCHHIIPRENRQFRYLEDNGITLCGPHHKWSRILSAHNNPLAFYLWLQKYKPGLYEKAVERTKQMLKDNGIII